MKICTKDTEEVRGLRYEDLEVGDIFVWIRTNDNAVLKTSEGYVYLLDPYAGKHYDDMESADSLVTRFPNACIDPGDPE